MREWTQAQKLQHLLTLPWSVRVTREDGDLVARVDELPGIIGVGANERSLHADLYQAVSAALEVALEFGDPITLPTTAVLPWLAGEEPRALNLRFALLDKTVAEEIRAMASGSVRRLRLVSI